MDNANSNINNGGLGAVTREFTTMGAGDSRGVLWIVLVFAPDASPRGKRQKPQKPQHIKAPVPQGLYTGGPSPRGLYTGDPSPRCSTLTGGPCFPGSNPGNPKGPESQKSRPRTLLLGESCRSVRCPPTPGAPQADREGHLTGPRPEARKLHHRAAATPSSRLVRVDGSRKLPQITYHPSS